jgi:hypothetical protein
VGAQPINPHISNWRTCTPENLLLAGSNEKGGSDFRYPCHDFGYDKSVGNQFKGLLALQKKGSSDSCRCRIGERELASCTYWST